MCVKDLTEQHLFLILPEIGCVDEVWLVIHKELI